MGNLLKKIIIMFSICIVAMVAISFGFFFNDIRNSRVVTGAEDELTGQRIGVMSGWESDYYLSPRKDLTLKRYDETADLFMALSYKQVDAVAVDTTLYILAESSLNNIKKVGEPLSSFYYTYYSSKGSKMKDKMNEFISFYLDTDEYKEYVEKALTLEWIDSDDYTPETGTGEVLRIGYSVDTYPNVFADEEGNVRGPEAEFLVRFANYYNYKIDWVPITEATSDMEISNGRVDLASCCGTDLYRDELEQNDATQITMTDGFIKSDIYLVVIDGELEVSNSDLYDNY